MKTIFAIAFCLFAGALWAGNPYLKSEPWWYLQTQQSSGSLPAPLAAWPMQTTADTSGNGYTLTLTGSPSVGNSGPTAGFYALNLNGSSQYASASGLKTLTNYPNLTVCGWFYPKTAYSAGVQQQVLGCNDSSYYGVEMQIYNGVWECGWVSSSDTRWTMTASSLSWPQNTWIFYALTISPTTTTFYTNGVVMGTPRSVVPVQTGIGQSISGFNVGVNYSTSATFYLNGNCSLVQIYTANLTSAQVASKCYWTGGTPGNGSCLPTGL